MKIIPLRKYQNVHFKVSPSAKIWIYIKDEIYYLENRYKRFGDVYWHCKTVGKEYKDNGTQYLEEKIDEYFKDGEWIKI